MDRFSFQNNNFKLNSLSLTQQHYLAARRRMTTPQKQPFPAIAGLVLFTLVRSGGSSTSDCPAGYICKLIDGVIANPIQSTNCSDLKNQVYDAGYGNILDGTYCPEGVETLQNCPVGRYCEDPAEAPKICPEGYFCPTKTADFTNFKCVDCKAGAKSYPIRLSTGYMIAAVVGAVFLATFLYLYLRVTKHGQKKNEDNGRKNASKLRAREHARLQRAKPILQKIDRRLGGAYIVQLNSAGELVDYDSKYLFNAIDTDNTGFLSFDELQKALQLPSSQLHVFIKMMIDAGGVSSSFANRMVSREVVSREVFADSFLDTITKFANFDIHKDAIDLFEEIVREHGVSNPDVISLDLLKYSSLSLFLSDKDILKLTRLLQLEIGDEDLFEVDPPSPALMIKKKEGKGGSSSRLIDLGISSIVKQVSSSIAKQVSATFLGAKDVPTISKEDFAAKYPSMLQVVVKEDEEQLQQCDIRFENLSLHVHVKKEDVPVVNNVSGRVQSGAMTALMGGSGAGKTSLLNSLCGRAYYGTVSGKVIINGQEANIDEFTDIMGFVPQDDIVFAELTVRENLIYAGKFKLPKDTPMNNIKDLADEVIADLGLTRVADSRVGDVTRRGVSGGEKKRVNIGLELMAKPSILFLDEPTSGLDSSSAMVVIQCLKHLVVNQGMTVCCVIHQPRKAIFKMFDSLILLGVGGSLVYHGPTDTSRQYFTNMNYELPEGESLADWLIDISSGELEPNSGRMLLHRQSSTLQEMSNIEKASINRESLYENWKLHCENQSAEDIQKPEDTLPHSRTNKPGFVSQTWYQLTRCAILFNRNISAELQDAFLYIFSLVAIVLLEDPLTLTSDLQLGVPNEYSVLTGVGNGVEENIIFDNIALPNLFSHARRGMEVSTNFTTKTSIVICVLTALSSVKALTQKRIEFFREAGSGYDINAYYLAVNIFDTIRVSIKMVMLGLINLTFRNTAATPAAMLLQFILLGWIAASWGLLFPLCVAPTNVFMVAGFFSVFTSLLLSGAIGTPIEYENIYDVPIVNVFSSFIGIPRFFTESLVINEIKTTPEQHGFTWADNDSSIFEKSSYFLRYGGNDSDVYGMSKNGWYWGVLPSIFVGLTIRTLGFILIHACNRPNRLKQKLSSDLKNNSSVQIGSVLFVGLFTGFAVIAAILFI